MLFRSDQVVRGFLMVAATMLLLVPAVGCRKRADPPGWETTGGRANRTPAEYVAPEDDGAANDEAVDDGLIPIPDGSPEELLDFMNELAARAPQGDTPAEQDVELTRVMETRVRVAERIINSQDTPHWLRLVAVESKLESMRTLVILGKEHAFEDLQTYAVSLAEQDNSELTQLGRLSQFQLELDKLMAKMSDEPSKLMTALDEILENEQPDRTVHRVVSSVADLLSQIGYSSEAAVAAEKIYKKFGTHEEQEVRESSISLYTGLMLHAAERTEYAGDIDGARTMYEGIAEAIQHAPAAIADQVNQSLVPARRRLALLGQPLEVTGETLDGEPLDWSQYRGKVVLVDFWATWCGPCIAEIPNIRANYDKFHDRGFEVVGVNLDASSEEVAAFLKQEQLPWVTVVGKEGQTGFDNPNAVRNGVTAIPFLALIDAHGRVAALHRRGPALEQEVTRLLADVPMEEPPHSGEASADDD